MIENQFNTTPPVNAGVIERIFRNPKFWELIRFGMVGVLATVMHYGVYYLLIRFNLNASLAFTVGYGLAWICNFFLTASFTFREKATVKKGVGFAVSHGINWLLQVGFLNLFLWMGVPKALGPIPVWCVCIPLNFLMVRFVFKSKKL